MEVDRSHAMANSYILVVDAQMKHRQFVTATSLVSLKNAGSRALKLSVEDTSVLRVVTKPGGVELLTDVDLQKYVLEDHDFDYEFHFWAGVVILKPGEVCAKDEPKSDRTSTSSGGSSGSRASPDDPDYENWQLTLQLVQWMEKDKQTRTRDAALAMMLMKEWAEYWVDTDPDPKDYPDVSIATVKEFQRHVSDLLGAARGALLNATGEVT